ncbi:unnamed protein product, partial [marine sediment metagenome]
VSNTVVTRIVNRGRIIWRWLREWELEQLAFFRGRFWLVGSKFGRSPNRREEVRTR